MSDDRDIAKDGEQNSSAEPSSATAPVSRRAALKVLGAVPIAGALGSGLAWGQGTPAQAPSHPAGTHPAPAPASAAQAQKRAFFTAAEFRTVSVLADDVIPRDARSGSATDAGVPAFIDFHLSVPETDAAERVAIRGGLAWLDIESRKRFRKNYVSLSTAQRHEILDDIAWPEKAKPGLSQGAVFFDRFRDFVGMGFFSSAIGWKDLRYEGNVFNPNWQGCPEPAMKKLGVSFAAMDTRIPVE
jgi:gluconate 2-dehydrogenase subunit 3-like protein